MALPISRAKAGLGRGGSIGEPERHADRIAHPDQQRTDGDAQARAELEKANARFLLAIRAKLSPDQWKQLQAARAERHEMRQMPPGARGMHRMHPQGGPAGAPGAGPQGAPQGDPGSTPQFAPPDGPGPQSTIPQGSGPDWAPGPPTSAEAGAIE